MLNQEELKCELCFLPFDKGDRVLESLACGHVFCSLCQKDLLHDGAGHCPVCFETTTPTRLVRSNTPETSAENMQDLLGSSLSSSFDTNSSSSPILHQFGEWCIHCGGFADIDCSTLEHGVVSVSSDEGKELVKLRARLIAAKYHLRSAIYMRSEVIQTIKQTLSSLRSHMKKFERVLAWNKVQLYKLETLFEGLGREGNRLVADGELDKHGSVKNISKLYSIKAAEDLEEIEAVRRGLTCLKLKLVDDEDDLPSFRDETHKHETRNTSASASTVGTPLCDSPIANPKGKTRIETEECFCKWCSLKKSPRQYDSRV